MQTEPLKNIGTTTYGVVVALFKQTKHVCDAVADLAHAGFGKEQIRVAFPFGNENESRTSAEARHEVRQADPWDQHSLSWKLRQSFQHDLHRKGADQIAGEDQGDSSTRIEAKCSEVDLRHSLMALGAGEPTVHLLSDEAGPDGAIVLVDAGHRWKEADSILDRNSGLIRTDTATALPPSAE